MGKFIKAKFKSSCAQTGKEINVGDDIYYVPGRGAYVPESGIYKGILKSAIEN